MNADIGIDAVRRRSILSASAGFPFLLTYSIVWLAAGALSYALPSSVALWIYLLGGLPAAPIAIALEQKVAFVRVSGPDPILPLTLQILFVQIVAFPAVMLVWDLAPNYTPVAFAAVVGGHFLPFQWVYGTRLYGVLGVTVAAGSYLLGAIAGPDSIHYTGFFVGGTLLVGAFFARSHARSVWLESLRSAEPSAAAGGGASSA